MKFILAFALLICVTSCSVFQKEDKPIEDWNLFSQIEIRKDTLESVREKFGNPDEIETEYMGPKEIQWNYMRDGIPKILTYFKNGILESISMDVWNDKEPMSNLSYLLDKFPGKWKVEKEPVTHPHVMPFLCYLIDESQGKRIEIHSNKKIVESISKRSPELLKNRKKNNDKYPDVDPNRCDWLKDFLKPKGLLAN